jgi:large repetitive protein
VQGGPTVEENTANNNAFFGIEAVHGANDGGGNAATGNGEVNCVGVPCGTTSTCPRSAGL